MAVAVRGEAVLIGWWSLQAERQSLRGQLERGEAETRLAYEQSTVLTGRLHKVEREVNSLTSQVNAPLSPPPPPPRTLLL